MEKHKNSHLEGELVKLRKSSVEIVSDAQIFWRRATDGKNFIKSF